MIKLLNGDCREMLKALPSNSVDACVTDPPYGLSFMGKAWDYDVPGVETWREVFRVLKPGAHLLSFFGSRTYHRGVIPIEDAGFEIRDQIMWLYGSGFPKSHNLEGAHEGWGTALKPAHEPIVVARKPFSGTVAKNMLAHGTGGLNIDGCRIEGIVPSTVQGQSSRQGEVYGADQRDQRQFIGHDAGRWPANVMHDGSDEVLDGFPHTKSGNGAVKRDSGTGYLPSAFGKESRPAGTPNTEYGDEGSAARFFYCAKTSKRDRDEGLENAKDKVLAMSNQAIAELARGNMHKGESGVNTAKIRKNNHPTVKPTDLMRYLCRLVTPPGGTVLDPFMGSGSTGKAAILENFNFIGVELSPDYLAIAKARIYHSLGSDLV